MRVLSDGRERRPFASMLRALPLAAVLSGIVVLACVGAFVTVRALVEWLT